MSGFEVFLSHSGHQKDFVEQLYVDLKREGIDVFFDEKSLSEGEEYPQELIQAASTCKLVVPVLSEEFFTVSSWPIAEIIASVQAKTITSVQAQIITSVQAQTITSVQAQTITSVPAETIACVRAESIASEQAETIASVQAESIASEQAETIASVQAETIASVQAKTPKLMPLFYSISPKTTRDATKQAVWCSKWKSWRMERHNMDVEQWKKALKVIGITSGVVKGHLREVEYRRRIVSGIKRILSRINSELVSDVHTSYGGSSYRGSTHGRSSYRGSTHGRSSYRGSTSGGSTSGGSSSEGSSSGGSYQAKAPVESCKRNFAPQAKAQAPVESCKRNFAPQAKAQAPVESVGREFVRQLGLGLGIGLPVAVAYGVVEATKPYDGSLKCAIDTKITSVQKSDKQPCKGVVEATKPYDGSLKCAIDTKITSVQKSDKQPRKGVVEATKQPRKEELEIMWWVSVPYNQFQRLQLSLTVEFEGVYQVHWDAARSKVRVIGRPSNAAHVQSSKLLEVVRSVCRGAKISVPNVKKQHSDDKL